MSCKDGSSTQTKIITVAGLLLFFVTCIVTCIVGAILMAKTLLEQCLTLASGSTSRQRPLTQQDVEDAPPSVSSSGMLENSLKRGKEAIAIWSGLVGLFVTAMWMLGRAYARGYFERAMKIPLYHLQFSVWEYGETSWWILLLGAGIIALLSGFIILLLDLVFDLLYANVHILRTVIQSQQVQKIMKILAIVIIFVIPLLITLGFQQMATEVGTEVGRKIVTEEGLKLDLVSDTPLHLGSSKTVLTTTISDTESLFYYQDLRLLTFNNGRYFVFNRLDSATCQPESVYVVDEDQLVQVRIETAPALLPECTPLSTNTLSSVSVVNP